MSHFTFKAKKPTGETYKGERDAIDRFELYKLLRETGDEVLSVHEKKVRVSLFKKFSISSPFKRVKAIEKINFARNLGSMLEAGLALSRALSVLERQTRNKTLNKIIRDLNDEIGRGTTFSEALGKYEKIFPKVFTSMVHAGEQSGTLSDSLKVVATQMDNSYALERRIKGALIYPTVIVFIMVVIAVLMFIFVVPTLMSTFTELSVDLPITTRIVLGISNAIKDFGLLIIIALATASWVFYWWSKKDIGKKILHSLILKMPIVGPLVQEVNAARTTRTLSSLLKAGVPVVEAIGITATVVQNVHFRSVLKKAEEAIKKGELISSVFDENVELYPVFVAEMMSVGEETGQIGEMLLGVAKYYEDDVEHKTKDMSTVIEPILMVVIASAVGFFAVSMISPMYSLVNAI